MTKHHQEIFVFLLRKMFEHHKEFQVSKEYPKANYSLHPNKYAMGLRHKCRQQQKNADALSIKILFVTFGSSL